MAYESLKQEIRQYIKTNGQNEITGQILQDVLIDMVNQYPSLDGYATMQWVENQGYISEADLTNYATQSWVSSNYATLSTVNGLSYINGVTSDGLGRLTLTGPNFPATVLDFSHQHRWEELIDVPTNLRDLGIIEEYLPLSGGTMTGSIRFTADHGIVLDTDNSILVDSTDSSLCVSAYDSVKFFIDSAQNVSIDSTAITAPSFVKSGGTSSQFLKADGSVDSNTYATQSWVGQQGYITSSSLSGYATQSWVSSNYATLSTVNALSYINGVTSDGLGRLTLTGPNFPATVIDFSHQHRWEELIDVPTNLRDLGIIEEYLPLSAGSSYPLNGDLYLEANMIRCDYTVSPYSYSAHLDNTGLLVTKAQHGVVEEEYYVDVDCDKITLYSYLEALGDTETHSTVITPSGITIDGNSVWHEGNLNPSNYMLSSTAVINSVVGDELGHLTLTGPNFPATVIDFTHQHRWEELIDVPTNLRDLGIIEEYLPLSGGTMTGSIRFTADQGIVLDTDNSILVDSTDSSLCISAYDSVKFFIDSTQNVSIDSTAITAPSFVKSGGTSSQFLKADGSVDSNTYATQSWVGQQGYITSSSLSGYATESWVSSNYATLSAVNALSYINGVALNGDGSLNLTGHSFTTTILDMTHQHRWEELTDRPLIDMWNDTMVAVNGIVSSGKIGAGVSATPSYMLEVVGQAMIYSNVGIGTSPASGISLDIDGTARANSFVNSSDIRKKDVIEYDVDPGFETVANAPTIRFTWKDRGMLDNCGECVGSIAQYWQMALPEAVMTDSDGYLSMQYDVIALIAAVSVAKRVASHEQRIKELERENALLRMDIKALKGEA